MNYKSYILKKDSRNFNSVMHSDVFKAEEDWTKSQHVECCNLRPVLESFSSWYYFIPITKNFFFVSIIFVSS